MQKEGDASAEISVAGVSNDHSNYSFFVGKRKQDLLMSHRRAEITRPVLFAKQCTNCTKLVSMVAIPKRFQSCRKVAKSVHCHVNSNCDR